MTKGLHYMGKAHPSPELLQRYFEAYQKEGEEGIRRVMREQQEKGAYVENLIRQSLQSWKKDNPMPK